MPYRYNGERRCIRPLQGLPIDILGSSGFAIAPPSMGETRLYEFEQGTLADFDRLPPLRVEKVALVEEPRLGSALVGQGQRHEMLKRALGHEIWHADDWESFLDRAITVGTMHCTPPLEATEITDLAAWFWRHKEAGLLRRVGHRHWTRDVFDLLLTDRNAGLLLHALHVEHPGESQKFVIANAWSKKLRMKRDTLAAKRKMLAVLGKSCSSRPRPRSAPRCIDGRKMRGDVGAP